MSESVLHSIRTRSDRISRTPPRESPGVCIVVPEKPGPRLFVDSLG